MREAVLRFGPASSLVGILTLPPSANAAAPYPTVILLNAGLIHRVGPNRLYVRLARAFAALGYATLRFDFSGTGDSPVRRDPLPFAKRAVGETQDAMTSLQTSHGCRCFILMGICSGANTALRTALCDTRVVGVGLLNARYHLHAPNDPGLDAIRRRSLWRHYWRLACHSSFRSHVWRKMLTGRIDYHTLRAAIGGVRPGHLLRAWHRAGAPSSTLVAEVQALVARGVKLLHVYAEGDPGLDYLHLVLGTTWQHWPASLPLHIEVIRGVNHTFMPLWSQERLQALLCQWLQTSWGRAHVPDQS